METSPARGTPEQSVVAPVVSTEKAPVASSSSLQQPDLNSKIQNAKSPAEVRALIKEQRSVIQDTLRKPDGWKPGSEAKPATPTPSPVEATPEAPVAEETPTGEQPVADEAETTEETPVTPEETIDPDEDDAGGDGPVTPITGKRAHLRLAADDKVGRLAASLMKRNRDMPMEEAVDRARTQLGIKTPESTTETPAVKSDLPQTVEQTTAELYRLDIEREKALVELRFEDVAKIDRNMRKLDRHQVQLERQAEQSATAEAAAYDRGFTTSQTKAADLYEFAGKPESDGAKRMIEIEEVLKANGDPLYFSPDKPLRIAQMVAAELHIAPRRKGASAAPAKAAAPAPATIQPKKQVLPGGGSRTTPPPTNQPSAVDQAIRNAPKTLAGIRDLRKQLGLQH